jgi:hypothetical protein
MPQNTKQDDCFQKTALPIVESVLEGYNGTILYTLIYYKVSLSLSLSDYKEKILFDEFPPLLNSAYGQTGTGKTHTMEGIPEPACKFFIF